MVARETTTAELARRRKVWRRMRDALDLGPRALPLSVGLWSTGAVGQALWNLDRPHTLPSLPCPVFLIGAPRTGTTFLQRLLVDLEVGRGLPLGRMLCPSRHLQPLLGPVWPRLDALGLGRFHDPQAHESGLSSVETEDAALLFRFLDGFLAYAFFGAWSPLASLPDPTDAATIRRDLDWLDGLWRARRAETGGRIVAKAASFGLRVRDLRARYPTARFICTLRDPVEVLPSVISLVQGAVTRRFPHLAADSGRCRVHTANLYRAVVQLLNRFAEHWCTPGFPREAVLLCPYSGLLHHLEPEVHRIFHHLAIEPSPPVRARLAAQARAQARRRSGHRYSLEQLGLEAAQVRSDCSPFFDTFGSMLSADRRKAC